MADYSKLDSEKVDPTVGMGVGTGTGSIPIPIPTPVSPPPKIGVLVGLSQLLLVVMPFLFMGRLATMDLPPWAEKLSTQYGPVMILLGMGLALIWRYFPPGMVSSLLAAQQLQASGMQLMALALRDLSSGNGPFLRMDGKLERSLRIQYLVMERLRIIESEVLHLKRENEELIPDVNGEGGDVKKK